MNWIALLMSMVIWVVSTFVLIHIIVEGVKAHSNSCEKEPVISHVVVTPKENMSVKESYETLKEEIRENVTEDLEIKDAKRYYNVPLSQELQDHIFELCDGYSINPALVIAMIDRESRFNSDAIGDGGDSLGLMQIQPKWNYARMEELGCADLIDPFQNVEVGIDILAELFATGKSTEWVLMAYNGGQAYANEKQALGIVSNYAATVIANSQTLDTYEVG